MWAFSILDKTYSEQLFHTAVQIQSDCVHTWSSPIRILAQSTSIRWYRIQAKSRPNPICLRSHWTRYPSAVQIQSESTSENPPLVEEKRQDITDVLQRSFKQLFMWLSNPGHCKITLFWHKYTDTFFWVDTGMLKPPTNNRAVSSSGVRFSNKSYRRYK